MLLVASLAAICGIRAAEDASSLTNALRRGRTLYVSKLGDNSDGSSWQKAFHTIQAALLAVPDNQGGHRVIVRPDTYAEANLYPAQQGAAGAYNILEGDWDGSLGSGATGWVVVDSGAPLAVVRTDPKAPTGNPTFMLVESNRAGEETGFKSVDWWSSFRASPEFSGVGWDRWILRHIYATGSDAGLFWDLPPKIEPFTVVVEDSVGIGRAFGGGAAHFAARAAEPIVFRRCKLWCLDWWGDAAGAYVRAENSSLPAQPDVTFEDCTLVGPDNALQAGNPGFSGFTRVKLTRCRLVSLNFSQPQGTPSTGIIFSTIDGKLLRVDLEDCTLMGYKVFGAGKGEVGFSVKGKVQAYVQYRQPVPAGFERMRFWPAEVFNEIAPARFPAPQPAVAQRPKLIKLPENLGSQTMECTPIEYLGRQILFQSWRGTTTKPGDTYLALQDLATGQQLCRFGDGFSLGCALVKGTQINAYATQGDIYRFISTDGKTWTKTLAVARSGDEHLFNSSVCQDNQGYLMAYETDKPVSFGFKFARSKDLASWEKMDGLIFAGVGGKEYSACPVIRYFEPYYYVIYLHTAIPGHTGFVSFLARSKDLATWELTPFNPILEAGPGEGINNSDVDLIEIDGTTYVYYATGDQQTWLDLKRAVYPGPMKEFFAGHFPAGLPTVKLSARR